MGLAHQSAIGAGKPDVKTYRCAATEINRRFSDVVQNRITSQRRSRLRDIATLILRVAEKKEALTSLQSPLNDVHSYCGNTQTGHSAILLSSMEIVMTSATTTATVTKDGDKFTCTLNGTVLGTSKHQDYFEYHLKKGDVKALREAGITGIDYVDGGIVTKTWIKAAPAVTAVQADSTAQNSATTATQDVSTESVAEAVA